MSDRDEERPKSRTGCAVAAGVGIGAFVLLVVAAIALPGHVRFEPRARQSEARSNLKAILTAELAYLAEKDVFGADFRTIGFQPGRGTRYAYFLAPQGDVFDWPSDPNRHVGLLERPVVIFAHDAGKHPKERRLATWAATGCPLTPARHPDGAEAGLGVSQRGDSHVVLAAAAGNVDRDAKLDCWSISNVDRTAADGSRILAREPYLEQTDLDR